MRAREKEKHEMQFETKMFNIHAIGEVLVYDESFGCDLFFVKDLDVLLKDGTWKDMRQAFKDHDLITDNYNTYIFEPENEEDRERGYTL